MSALPTSSGALSASARSIHVANAADIMQGYPATDSARMVVPFGTRVLGVHGLLGTVKSGSLEFSGEKKTRSDGEGGTEAKAFVNMKWSGEVTCTFRVMRIDTAAGAATSGQGPIPLGAFINFQTPKVGATFAAPTTGTVAAVTGFESLMFTVENLKFNFQDGEYAEWSLTVEHCRSLEGQAGVTTAEVGADGLLITKVDEVYGI